MKYINEIIYVLMALIPIGAVPRAIYCLCKIMNDAEQEHSYKSRMKNLAAFIVIAECTLSIIKIVRDYF